ncbi:MAG: thermonuclease family protein [Desulfocucumaceae bacterium]
MKKAVIIIIVIILLAGCSGSGVNTGRAGSAGKASVPPGGEGRNWVRVARVIDGDTFEIANRGKPERVRLIGVDTPESVKPDSPVEPYGIEASKYTKELIGGKMVRLEFDVQERDKYGRLLAYVYLEDGTMVNAKLLEEGMAVIMTIPPNVRMADTFLKIQRKAREEKKGLWKD